MPAYTLQDPTTGASLTVSGDAPPTADEAAQLFAAVKAPPSFLERNAGSISRYARPVLETAGMIGGGVLGATAAAPTVGGVPVGGAAGGALGLAGGKAAADLLDRALGIKPALASLPAAAAETAGDVKAGAAAEAAGLAGGKILEGAADLVAPAAKKAMTAILGPSGEAIDARIARNAEVQAAKPMDVLARELPESVNELNKKVSQLSGEALDTLPQTTSVANGAVPTENLEKAIYAQKEALGDGISNATARAKKTLDGYLERLSELPDTLSQYDVGKFIRDFDNDIDWGKAELAPQNHALQGLRTDIDGQLKTINPDYAAAMAPTAEATGLLVKARQLFNLKNDVGHGLVAGNNTMTALESAVGDKRLDSQAVLQGLQKYTGRDYLQEAQDAITASKFAGGKINGSRRTVMGMGAGAALGSKLAGPAGGAAGGVAGGLLGMHLDTQGHELAGGLIDQLVRLSQQAPRGPAPSMGLQQLLAIAAARSRLGQANP